MKTGKVILGFMAGLTTGAILGILFSPAKGSSTRKKIARKGDEYLHELEDKFDHFVDSFSKKIENVKGEAMRMAEDGKKKVEAAENKFNNAGK